MSNWQQFSIPVKDITKLEIMEDILWEEIDGIKKVFLLRGQVGNFKSPRNTLTFLIYLLLLRRQSCLYSIE